MRYLTGGQPTSRADVATALDHALGHRWLVFERTTAELVGWFSSRISAVAERELGYRLRREMWGRGFATEGCRALVRLAFVDLDADRVWAQTMRSTSRHARSWNGADCSSSGRSTRCGRR